MHIPYWSPRVFCALLECPCGALSLASPNLHHVHYANSQSPCICTLAYQPPFHGWCTIMCPPYTFPSTFCHFPTPRCCHTCSKSGHIAAFGCSRPPHHPQPGVTPLQHQPQRPFFWEAGTLIGGPPPLSSYPQQCFACTHMPSSISSQITLHLDLPVHPCHSSTWGSLAHHQPQRPSFWLVGAPIKCPPPPPISLQHSVHACILNPATFPHLDMSICPCQPSWRTFSPLISPSSSNFPMGGGT